MKPSSGILWATCNIGADVPEEDSDDSSCVYNLYLNSKALSVDENIRFYGQLIRPVRVNNKTL